MIFRDDIDSQSIRSSARFDNLDAQSQRIIAALLEHKTSNEALFCQNMTDHTKMINSTLSQFLNRLENMNQDGPRRIGNDSVLNLRHIAKDDLPRIKPEVEMFNMSQPDEVHFRSTVSDMILKKLSFPTMQLRYEDVVEPYPATFAWVFSEAATQHRMPWSNFVDWLSSGHGIYWVNGKAGSGKSTLMKHIFDQPETRRYLTTWAKDVKICIASFFFWNSGSPQQKSQIGMLRAIVFQILQQIPEIAPVVLPEYWARIYSDLLSQKSEKFDIAWSLRDLRLIFTRIVVQSNVPLRIFLLVDGLDEFNGDHDDLVEFFSGFRDSNNIKACVSSRPWVVFEEAFGGGPRLRLQDITRPDILQYVSGKFHRNSSFRRLKAQNPIPALNLINEVAERADGVFLWVFLVVKSLLDGLRNRDDIHILRTRLRILPRELEPLYRYLLSLVEPVYLGWASQALQVMRAFSETGAAYQGTNARYTKPPKNGFSIAQLYLALSKDLNIGNLEVLGPQQINSRCQDMLVHLTARCAGLLEVPGFARTGSRASVQYIHATARTFLQSDENWPELVAHTSNTNFCPHVCLMRSCLFSLWIDKYWDYNVYHSTPHALISFFTFHASCADENPKNHEVEVALLDRLDQIKTVIGTGKHWSNDFLVRENDSERLSFIYFATVYGLTGYVKMKLQPSEANLMLYPNATTLLNYYFQDRDPGATFFPTLPRIQMVTLLLELGADPNWRHQGSSAWSNLLYQVSKATQPSGEYNEIQQLSKSYVNCIKAFLIYGASPHARVHTSTEEDHQISVLEIVTERIMRVFPTEGAAIRTELERLTPPADLAVLQA